MIKQDNSENKLNFFIKKDILKKKKFTNSWILSSQRDIYKIILKFIKEK